MPSKLVIFDVALYFFVNSSVKLLLSLYKAFRSSVRPGDRVEESHWHFNKS